MNRVSRSPPPPVNRPPPTWTSGGITVLKKLIAMKDAALRTKISSISLKKYGQEAKPLQIDAVVSLVRGQNTFLLAGTGFGKSRIPELYFRTLPVKEKPVIIVLNPLDLLGDNQVVEKNGGKVFGYQLNKAVIQPKRSRKHSLTFFWCLALGLTVVEWEEADLQRRLGFIL
ncbi:hypothetical protein Pst134EA_000014 [Puccinia striiformis f. sp. tritici]|uniref:hypothetical protein n=1 Tax=Puccinia striiformis f. sp. tritici TaxID=168172 RepID=UPI002008C410|nr:hypothetical protein Pst134EA_000014 [Puccinia striiformis f. sp. tritici]KAH9472928.1 hypothetical protein Pst134EA_000014 [Puccinia striiformis f. sp. tritici]